MCNTKSAKIVLSMLDIFTRALLHPLDYSGVLRRQQIEFIDKKETIPGTWTFAFKKPTSLTWKAGQHALFSFSHREIDGKSWRAFSVASSSHENVVRIATNIPEQHSNFKRMLLELTAGDTVRMYGPHGEFYATGKPQHIIGIAGGIGVTPFRALAYEITHGYLPGTKLTLIYSAKERYTFETELTQWRQQCENLMIKYVRTPEEVTDTLQTLFDQHKNDADYYISGAPGMINALKKSCKAMGIRRITNDPFKGY